jgi:hypothetical protein
MLKGIVLMGSAETAAIAATWVTHGIFGRLFASLLVVVILDVGSALVVFYGSVALAARLHAAGATRRVGRGDRERHKRGSLT